MAAASPQASYQPDPTTFEEARTGAEAYLRARLSAKGAVPDSQFTVPTIDLSPSFSSSLPDRQRVADQIRAACTTSGFFYITNHGVPEKARQSVIHQTERFMSELSAEKKEAIHTKNSKLGLGWEPSEYTSLAGDEETKEAFNFAYEEALDRSGGDGMYRNLDGTKYNGNLWPKEEDLPGFRGEIREYYGAVSLLSMGPNQSVFWRVVWSSNTY
jgi:isopenicillin N synthase-like dioxygenase